MSARLRRRVVNVTDRMLSARYEARHPGAVARGVIAALGPIVRACQPNDKWNLHVMAPGWAAAATAPPLAPLPPSRSIFLFCAYRGVFTHHLVLAALLAWRGHRVTIGYLPRLQSPSKHPLRDHPSARPYLRSALHRVSEWSGGRVQCVDLSETSGSVAVDEAFVGRQARYDTVMTHQKEGLDFTDPEVRGIHDHMLAVGREAQAALRRHLAAHRYDVCLVGNGTTFAGAHACRVMRDLGFPVNAFEKFTFRGVRVVNHGDHFLNADDIDLIWARRDELGYTREPYRTKFLDRARRSIEERSTNSTQTWYWELQRAVGQTHDEALGAAGIAPGVPFVLVCPNVVFDAGYGKITNVFASMKEWLHGTVEFLLQNTEHLVVVRAHPGEGLWYAGKEPVHQLLADRGLVPGPRLVVIPGPAKVNTYRLMERCRFGVVFSSSVGLEMAVLGKHVAVASNVVYARRGFTHDCDTPSEYYERLKALATPATLPPLDAERRERALLFYFVYHWAAQYPYPYDKPSGIARRPPAALVRTPDMAPHLAYLDLLAMTKDEFARELPRYLSAERVQERIDARD